jgi:MFS family permease
LCCNIISAASDGDDLELIVIRGEDVISWFVTALALLSFATYTVALIMRPVGGAIFGNFGDKHGRKKAMIITILGFSIVTFLTGLLPTWLTAGVIAPILLIILRFAQGLFAGGEWASGSVITMETAPKSMRGLLSGFVQSGYSFGFVIASLAYGLALAVFPGQLFIEIGWRVMFFTGIIPGLLALFIRLKMDESELWIKKLKEKKATTKSPLRKLLSDKQQRKRLLLALIIMTGLLYSYYTSIGFMPTFLEKYVKLNKNVVATIMIVVTIAAMIGTIFTGFLSQYIGRIKTLTIFAAAAIILAVPMIYGIYHTANINEKILYASTLVFVSSTAFGPIPAFLSERFPTEIRNSASGFAYNGGLIIGAWSPIIAIHLLSLASAFRSSSYSNLLIPFALASNIIIGAVIIFVGSRLNPDTRSVELG